MATRKKKAKGRKRIGALAAKHKATRKRPRIRARHKFAQAQIKRATRLRTVRAKVRQALNKPVPVVFAKTTTKRIRFILPTGKWSKSYANRGAARRGARRVYKTKITAQRVAA
jgi:hypothetical protein